MQAVDRRRGLDDPRRRRRRGRSETYKARDIFRKMAEAAWVCGDPGIQYDTTINDWHTSREHGADQRQQPVLRVHVPQRHRVQPGEPQPHEVRQGRTASSTSRRYSYAAKLTITAQEILVDNASYPTPRIEENSHKFRPLGLGYANLGALLMNRGLAYDSDEGRDYAAALTAIMHGEAYRQSARHRPRPRRPVRRATTRTASRSCGSSASIATRRTGSRRAGVPERPARQAARVVWDEALELGEKYGFRNAQVTVLAPTGTIAFMMDCDTTGVEPDIALIKYKKLVGGGFLKIVNQTVPTRCASSATAPTQVEEIVAYIDEHETIEGAPHLKAEHLPVFDCAFKPANGERSIHYMGHVRMMAAVQPFICGAISKTVNMPEAATAEEIAKVYIEGWKLGLKAIAVYRDNSQALAAAERPARRRTATPRRGRHRGRREAHARSSRRPRPRPASRIAAGSRRSGPRSPTSSTSPATRATSRSASTRTAARARSS